MRLISILRNVNKPWNYINYLNTTRLRKILPDKMVISCRFRSEFGRKLNLKSPQTFNEKLQWLKLYDRNPEYIQLVDKYEVKRIVAEKIGKKHIIPTYGVWNDADEIDFDSLPDTFVLKTTHDSHSIIICNDKATFDTEIAKSKLRLSLRNNYFYGGREWPYKNVVPRIIAEQLMQEDESGLIDYKIHSFNGKPKFILACSDRYTGHGLREVFYDLQWKKIEVRRPNSNYLDTEISKPDTLNDMIKMAEILSVSIPFVRVDFYQIRGNVYFGEMTFFPAGGYKQFIPEEYDFTFGNLLELNE